MDTSILLYKYYYKFKSNSSATLSRLNRCTDFKEIGLGDTLILREVHRLLLTTLTAIHAGGATDKI